MNQTNEKLLRKLYNTLSEMLDEQKEEENEVRVLSVNDSDFWKKVLNQCKSQVSQPSFATWFCDTYCSVEDDKIVVYATNEFACDWLSSHYENLIEEVIYHLTNKAYILEFTTNEREKRKKQKEDSGDELSHDIKIDYEKYISKKQSFEESILQNLQELIETRKETNEILRSLTKNLSVRRTHQKGFGRRKRRK